MGRDIDKIKFPCVYKEGKIVTTDDCFSCRQHDHCDIYASMLDEEYDDYDE